MPATVGRPNVGAGPRDTKCLRLRRWRSPRHSWQRSSQSPRVRVSPSGSSRSATCPATRLQDPGRPRPGPEHEAQDAKYAFGRQPCSSRIADEVRRPLRHSTTSTSGRAIAGLNFRNAKDNPHAQTARARRCTTVAGASGEGRRGYQLWSLGPHPPGTDGSQVTDGVLGSIARRPALPPRLGGGAEGSRRETVPRSSGWGHLHMAGCHHFEEQLAAGPPG